ERFAARDLVERGYEPPRRVLASPAPVDPFRRRILFEVEGAYGFGDFRWVPAPRVTTQPDLLPTNMDSPAIAQAARQEKAVADFLYWSRYPFASVERRAEGTEVVIRD